MIKLPRFNSRCIKSRYIFYLFTLITISACGEQDLKLEMLPEDAVILAFGDSLTFGKGARQDESYPVILADLSSRKVVNAGISGELSQEGLTRFPGVLDKHEPSLVILCHGGNDILRKKDLVEVENNLKKMVKIASERGINTVLLGVPKPGIFLKSADFYKRIADEHNLVFINDLIPEILSDNNLKSDTVHPNKSGYKRIAEKIFLVLKESGAL